MIGRRLDRWEMDVRGVRDTTVVRDVRHSRDMRDMRKVRGTERRQEETSYRLYLTLPCLPYTIIIT